MGSCLRPTYRTVVFVLLGVNCGQQHSNDQYDAKGLAVDSSEELSDARRGQLTLEKIR